MRASISNSKNRYVPRPSALAPYNAISAFFNNSSGSVPSSGESRNTYTDVRNNLMSVNLVGLDYRFPNTAREYSGVVRFLHLGHDDRELIAAQTRDRVGLPGATAQTVGNELQQFIANRVAKRIVELLKWSRSRHNTARHSPLLTV